MESERERFSPGELAVVLSHYDLGIVNSARELPRGSRHSPKLLLRTERGDFLLKRRAAGRDRPERVHLAHDLAEHLRARRFPAPRVQPTRNGAVTALTHDGRIYEMFEFVSGERFDGSLEEAMHAGKTLARFHKAIDDFQTSAQLPRSGYHDLNAVRSGLNLIPTTSSAHDSVVGREAELLALTQHLYERYDESADAVNRLGLAAAAAWYVHGDWHPGNMVFARGRVVAVLDFDAVRVAPRVTDVANGMLQFAILRTSGDPEQWPEFFDMTRMRRFFTGYIAKLRLPEEQRLAIPHLMIESLIAECAVPIAATGSFGPMPGFGVLKMARRKVAWILQQRPRMEEWLRD